MEKLPCKFNFNIKVKKELHEKEKNAIKALPHVPFSQSHSDSKQKPSKSLAAFLDKNKLYFFA